MGSIQASVRGEDAVLYIPRVQESTFGTENFGSVAADRILYRMHFGGEAPAIDPEITLDDDVASGSEFATEQNYGAKALAWSYSLPVTDVLMAHHGARYFGVDVVSAGDSANDKVHSLTRHAKGTGVPGFDFQYNTQSGTHDSDSDIRALGCQGNRMRVEWNRAGWARANFELIGCGRTGTVATAGTESSMVQGSLGSLWTPSNKIGIGILECTTHRESVLSGVGYDPPTAAGTFSNFNDGGTWVELAQEVESGAFEIYNALDTARAYAAGASSGAGVFREQAPIGPGRIYAIEMTVLAQSGAHALNLLQGKLNAGTSAANKHYAVKVESVSDVIQASSSSTDYRGWTFFLPIARIVGQPKPTLVRGMRAFTIRFEALKDQSSSAYNEAYMYVSTPYGTSYSATS